jgi:hypothetical protein
LLYTAPPASDYHEGWEEGYKAASGKREWVGLTDEEAMDAYCETPPFCTYTEAFIAGIRFIEAKLRSKNT